MNAFPSFEHTRLRCIERFGFDPEQSLLEWVGELVGDDATDLVKDGARDALVDMGDIQFPLRLTEREQMTFRLVARGLTNVEIGDVLCVSRETVKQNVGTGIVRMGARNRAHGAVLVFIAELCERLERPLRADHQLFSSTRPERQAA